MRDTVAARADFKQLRAQIEDRGLARRSTHRILGELAGHLTLTFAAFAVLVYSQSVWLSMFAVFLSAIGTLGVATNTHTSTHHATSERKWINSLLSYFGASLFNQISVTYWHQKHLISHHPTPNVVGLDGEIDIAPLFLLTEEEISLTSGWRRSYYRVQWIFLPFAVGLNFFSFMFDGWRFLLGEMRRTRGRVLSHWIDLTGLVMHWVLWFIIPLAIFEFTDVLLVQCARYVLMGFGMFIVFAPSHLPHEAEFFEEDVPRGDFVWQQTSTTLNYRTGWIGRLLCSGLEYQIEHHLFPRISHDQYPRISPLVRSFCARHGYPYRTLGWAEGVWKAWEVFRVPKTVRRVADRSKAA
ncbi:MAG: acyl-CoA desaturase [Acidobacteriota bacterium]